MLKFIKSFWLVAIERAKARKSVRILKEQEWSVEFLVYLLSTAAKRDKQGSYISLENMQGQKITIYALEKGGKNMLLEKEKELDVLTGNVTWEALRDAAEIRGML